jgi:hypothetical protein
MTPDIPGGPVDPLDAHLDALGGELDRGVVRAERTRRRRFRAAGASSALVAIGLGALVALPGGRELDPVAEARAAVADGGGILHFVVRMEYIPPPGSSLRGFSGQPAIEVWTATDGTGRYRMRQPMDGRPRYCSTLGFSTGTNSRLAKQLGDGPMLVSPGESAQDGPTQTVYSAFSRAAVIMQLPPADPADDQARGYSLTPAFGAAPSGDPVRAIRAALQSRQLRDGGTTTRDGRAVRKLVGTAGPTVREAKAIEASAYPARARWRKAQIRAGRPQSPTRYTYYVDADTAAPVELRTDRYAVWSRANGRRHWAWTGEISRFERFERLDASPASLSSLQIALPAGTTIYRGSSEHGFTPRVSFKQAMRGQAGALRRCNAAMR